MNASDKPLHLVLRGAGEQVIGSAVEPRSGLNNLQKHSEPLLPRTLPGLSYLLVVFKG